MNTATTLARVVSTLGPPDWACRSGAAAVSPSVNKMNVAVAAQVAVHDKHEHEHKPPVDEDGNPIDYNAHSTPKPIRLTSAAQRLDQKRQREEDAIDDLVDDQLEKSGFERKSSSTAVSRSATLRVRAGKLRSHQSERERYHKAMKDHKLRMQNAMAMTMFRNARGRHRKTEMRRLVTRASSQSLVTVEEGAAEGQAGDQEEGTDAVVNRKANKQPSIAAAKTNKVFPQLLEEGADRTPGDTSKQHRASAGRRDMSPELLAIAERNRKLAAVKVCWAKMKQAGFIPIMSVLTWIVLGTCVYHFGTGFYWSQAFFYAVDTGFSIGFGAFIEGTWNDSYVIIPSESCGLEVCDGGADFRGSLRSACMMSSYEPDLASMFYTVLHILFGASMVATALTLLLLHTLERSEFSPAQIKAKEVQIEKDRLQNTIERGNPLNKNKHANVARRKSLHAGGGADLNFVQRKLKRNQNCSAQCTAAMSCCKNYWVAAVKSTLFKATSFMLVWMLGAIAYGMAHEGWSFIESLYFAVSAASTAGLLAPTHHFAGNEDNCTNGAYGDRECQVNGAAPPG